MAAKKFSQISAAVQPFQPTDQIVGVQGGSKDVLYNIGDIAFPFHVTTNVTLNFYVSLTGSDSNNGQSPTTAFATRQACYNYIASNVLLAGGTIQINTGAGTFMGVTIPTINGGGIIQDYCNGSTSTTVIADPLGHSPPGCWVWQVPNPEITWFVDQVYLAPRTNRAAFNNALFNVDCRLGQRNQSGHDLQYEHANNSAFAFGFINDQGPQGTGTCTFVGTGSTSAGVLFDFNSFAYKTTVTGNWTLTQGWALAVGGGSITVDNIFAGGWIVSGTVTGQRYEVFNGGAISTFSETPGGLGPNWFPGNQAGFSDPISSYDGFAQQPYNEQSGTSFTASVFDVGGRIVMTNAGANTVTIPAGLSCEAGCKILITQFGAGVTTVAAGGGVTAHFFGALPSQGSTVAIVNRNNADEWFQTNA